MSILVVGTVALDTLRTPHGERTELLGGSATHFSASASFFTPVRLVAVVGEDFTDEHRRPLEERGVDLGGLVRARGRTFRWSGEYAEDLDNPTTLETQLNVLSGFAPRLPAEWTRTPVVFLANIDPELQASVLDQAAGSELVAADTMNFWIASKREAIARLLPRIHILFINDGEIRQLTGRKNVVEAAEEVRAMGARVVVLKRGEHGVLLFGAGETFALPAYPMRRVVDPTGAGDSFAGGFLGFLASRSRKTDEEYRRAAVVGSVMASFQVEEFGLARVSRLDEDQIRRRYEDFQRLTRFEAYPSS